MTNEEALRKYRDKAAVYASRGEKCLSQVREKLQQWSDGLLSSQEIDSILGELQEHRIIDEQRYARAYISDKIEYSRRGPIALKHELWQRGIPPEIIRAELASVSDDVWRCALRDFLTARRKSSPDVDPYVLRGRLYRAGISKGYPSEWVVQVMDQCDLPTDGMD